MSSEDRYFEKELYFLLEIYFLILYNFILNIYGTPFVHIRAFTYIRFKIFSRILIKFPIYWIYSYELS